MCEPHDGIQNGKGFVIHKDVWLYYETFIPKRFKKNVWIILIHGINCDRRVWLCQKDFLCEKGYNVLWIDMRGYGKSQKQEGSLTIETHRDDLYQITMKLEMERFILIGWSIGGAVAQSFALEYPEKVLKLVLVNTAPQFIKNHIFPHGKTAEDEHLLLEMLRCNYQEYAKLGAEAAIPDFGKSSRETEIIRKKIEIMMAESKSEIAYRQVSDLQNFSTVKDLHQITQPCLIITGNKDTMVNPLASVFMRERIPNSILYEFPQAGHAPFLNYSNQFNSNLLHFLEGDAQEYQICQKILIDLNK